ncbi:MAG: ATP-dependent helicase [Clostridia bacterium]|nr:ATP-dependent helicase [Clostridia bacterium]
MQNSSMDNALRLLTEKQCKAVVTESKKTAVVAGPGSGKTRVLTERICYLISEKGVNPSQILALTFTNKAANEMRKRVLDRLGAECNFVGIKTFHKLGLELLRNYCELINYESEFEIADPSTKNNIIREILNDENIPKNRIVELAQKISYIKNGLDVSDRETSEVFEKYNQELERKGMFDLDDFIWRSVPLLKERPLIQQQYHDKFKYILVDEYQDINFLQKEFIDLICGNEAEIFVVGDDDQCIYEWRGSSPSLLREFVKGEDVEVIRLEDNFRSEKEIVELSDVLIKNNFQRIIKAVTSKKKNSDKALMKDKIKYGNYPSDAEEARAITNAIIKLNKENAYDFGDIAILVRTNKQVAAITEIFEKNKIPYIEYTQGDNGFIEFIKVILTVNNFRSSKNIYSAINFPNRIIGNIAYKKLVDENGWKGSNNSDVFRKLYLSDIDFKNRNLFKARYELLKSLSEEKSDLSSVEIIKKLLDYYTFEDAKKSTERNKHIEQVEQILAIAEKYEEDFQATANIQEFIDFLQLTLQNEDEPSLSNGKVNIMTCHKAKGLEFPVVFIPGVQVGVFPNDFFVHNKADLEQERRLFYVTMTRAIDFLFITSYDNPLYVAPTNSVIKRSFISEISKGLSKM